MSSSNLKLSDEKNVDPLPEPRTDNSARPCTDCLASTELNRLGEPKRLYGETVARLEVWPYHRKKVTRLGQGLEGGVWISTLSTRGFSRVRREFLVLAEGWLIFGSRPKPRVAKPQTALEKSLAPRVLNLESRVKFPYIHESRSPFWSHFTNHVIR